MAKMSKRDKAMFSLGCKVTARKMKTSARRKRAYRTRTARAYY